MIKMIAVSAALALIAGSAVAAPPAGHGTAKVKVSDIDTNRPADTKRLQDRLETAALEACGAQPDSVRAVKWSVQRSDCYRETLAQAKSSVATTMALR